MGPVSFVVPLIDHAETARGQTEKPGGGAALDLIATLLVKCSAIDL
jgi:hypothetical protein